MAGLPILIPENEESVLLGAAILAACASQEFPNIQVQYVKFMCIVYLYLSLCYILCLISYLVEPCCGLTIVMKDIFDLIWHMLVNCYLPYW